MKLVDDRFDPLGTFRTLGGEDLYPNKAPVFVEVEGQIDAIVVANDLIERHRFSDAPNSALPWMARQSDV